MAFIFASFWIGLYVFEYICKKIINPRDEEPVDKVNDYYSPKVSDNVPLTFIIIDIVIVFLLSLGVSLIIRAKRHVIIDVSKLDSVGSDSEASLTYTQTNKHLNYSTGDLPVVEETDSDSLTKSMLQ